MPTESYSSSSLGRAHCVFASFADTWSSLDCGSHSLSYIRYWGTFHRWCTDVAFVQRNYTVPSSTIPLPVDCSHVDPIEPVHIGKMTGDPPAYTISFSWWDRRIQRPRFKTGPTFVMKIPWLVEFIPMVTGRLHCTVYAKGGRSQD